MTLLSAEELRELRRLHVQVGRRVDGLFAGDYRSAVRGRGMEFEEVRAYAPGDDVRHIDWNVTARSGEPFLKVFREERQNTVLLLVDVSGSTHGVAGGDPSGRADRRLQLARLAGGLAYAAHRNRDRVGLVTFTDRIEQVMTPRRDRSHAWAVIHAAYAGQAVGRGTDLAGALRFVAGTHRRRATILIASDFLDAGAWETPLGALCRRHTVYAACVHDPVDDGLAGLGLLDVVDAETGVVRRVDAARLRGKMPLSQRMARLQRSGAHAFAVSTADDAFSALQRELGRARRRR